MIVTVARITQKVCNIFAMRLTFTVTPKPSRRRRHHYPRPRPPCHRHSGSSCRPTCGLCWQTDARGQCWRGAMVNAIDLAKRALVKLLKEMAAIYTLTLSVARDSPDPAVRTAYRKVSVNALRTPTAAAMLTSSGS